MNLELIKRDQDFECFKVYNPKSPGTFIIIRGNRPMLQAKGLKKKPIDWRLIEGKVKNRSTYEQVIELINKKLNPPPAVKRSSIWVDAGYGIKRPAKTSGPGKYRGGAKY